jgi:phosphopantetheinyl transferase
MIIDLNKGILYRFKTPEKSEVVIADINVVTSSFSQAQLSAYQTGHSRERSLQMACADFIISDILGEDTKVSRTAKGAPFLKDKKINLSISHTSNYMAMIVNENARLAIDIEVKGRNIDRIKRRFTIDSEVEHFREFFQDDALLSVWGVKECLFKIMHANGVLFTDHLRINTSKPHGDRLVVDCHVDHPEIKSNFTVISCIFETLILSYIDAAPNAK